jgi:GTP cyclohydrolase III
MQFVPYRALQNEPSTLRKKMENEGDLIVTVGGKPFALMINLNENENVEDIFMMVSRMRAQMAVRALRKSTRQSGADKMSLKQINSLIKKTRAERTR